jgi:hypothetical protein
VSENIAPTSAGWYPLPQADRGGRKVGYWDGAAWSGAQRRANRGGSRPQDTPGIVALILLCAGFVGPILVVAFAVSGLLFGFYELEVAMLVVLSATPLALIASIAGVVRGHQLKFKTPLSLTSLILSIVGTVVIVLAIFFVVFYLSNLHI